MGRAANLHLTPRDLEIILMVYHYDGLVNQQIKRRFWPTVGARSPYYQRVARLIDSGYLRSIRLPSKTGLGSGPSLITIGPASHPILREQLGLSTQELKQLRRSYIPLTWQHDEAVRAFRLDLETACQRSGLVTLSEWINESELRRRPIKVELAAPDQVKDSLELVPDGIFTLTLTSGQSKRFYLELDNDSLQSPERFKRSRARSYLAHIGTRPCPVLFVVPSEDRRRKITRWIEDEAGGGPKLFAVAVKGDIGVQTVLSAPLWQVVGGSAMTLLPARQFGQRESNRQPALWFDRLLEGSAES